jgi:hypothetical protein
MTIQVMVDDLCRRGLNDSDTHRVGMAFSNLGIAIQKWPTPLMVIEALPKRTTPQSHWLGYKPKRTKNADEISHQLKSALRTQGKKLSVMLPGEGLGDYLRAVSQSGLSRKEFDRQRLEYNARIPDEEANIERAAIQAEGE